MMTKYSGDSRFQHDATACTGVLVVNLGTTDAPTPQAVRRFLAEFLWDPRVIEFPRALWWLILHGVILRIRPGRVARAYHTIWTEAGSPLLSVSQKQVEGLQRSLDKRLPGRVEVVLAMRYGQPSIEDGLNRLRAKGMRQLLVLPMYPQYSATTTASVLDEVFRVLGGWRWIPALRTIQHYHDRPEYIQALANSVREHWEQHDRPEKLLFSFHGLPVRYFKAGDPYFCECQKTGRLLAQALGLEDRQWQISFQSRVGREPWLQPYTDHTLRDWAKQGIRHVQVLCPGFSADCLETLEEIRGQNCDLFLANGGERYSYIPALNEHADHIEALTQLVVEQMQGWEVYQAEPLSETQRRACAQGATQ